MELRLVPSTNTGAGAGPYP